MSQKKIIGIVSKPKDPRAVFLSRELLFWLDAQKINYIVSKNLAEELGLTEKKKNHLIEDIASNCDCIVAFGGDGTLINIARRPVNSPPTILGVNLGKLGFLMETSSQELYEVIKLVLEGKAELEPRYLLKAQVQGKVFYAMNEVAVTRKSMSRLLSLDCHVDDNFIGNFRGDGLIISTPTGSTAYSLAAGGPIVHPLVHSIILTPICPHSLTTRPVVLPAKSLIKVNISEDAKKYADQTYVTFDGQESCELCAKEEVVITTSNFYVNFVKSPWVKYFDILGIKLKWAIN